MKCIFFSPDKYYLLYFFYFFIITDITTALANLIQINLDA